MAQMTNYTPATDIIDPNCMLLDTCYAISPIKNKDLIKKFEPVMQAKNSKRTQMVVTKNTATLILW